MAELRSGEVDGLVQWAAADECSPGEVVSGDASVVVPGQRGVLTAVIDGLGHGAQAAAAAAAACDALAAAEPAEDRLEDVMQQTHRALARTRGAAITLAWFEKSGLRWLAVGNVTGILVRPGQSAKHVPLRGGVVGASMPSLYRPDQVALDAGDVVVLATDGLRRGFSAAVDLRAEPQAVATALLRDFNRGTDDALVLVARFLARGTR